MENYKDIIGFEGKYQISDYGRIKSISRVHPHNGRKIPEIIRKLENHWKGYKTIRFRSGNMQIKFFVHRLVAQAFLLNPENKPIVNHIDGDKSNNVLSNLEWATESENMQHYQKVIRKRNAEF